jgi:hypothetical protein
VRQVGYKQEFVGFNDHHKETWDFIQNGLFFKIPATIVLPVMTLLAI